MRLPWYARRLQSGAMHAVTQAQTVVDAAAVAVLDGCDGIGQVLAVQATREAMRRAAKSISRSKKVKPFLRAGR